MLRSLTSAVVFVALGAYGQLSHGGTPAQWGVASVHADVLPTTEMGTVDKAAVEAAADTVGAPGGFRFGAQRMVSVDVMAQGQWTPMADGGRVCRYTIKSSGALMMSVQFSAFRLPWGARLFLYDKERTRFLGGFTQANGQLSGEFATSFLPGDAVTMEYQEPPGASPAQIQVASITHAWRSIFETPASSHRDLPTEYPIEPCHNNVACPIAADWQKQSRATLWFVMPDGRGCNGTLLNNTQQNGTPYVLIANHCYQPTESQWIFYFNFQSPTCVGDTGQSSQTMSGSVRRSVLYHGDYCLMELNAQPPPGFNAYYAGWDHSASPPQSGASILDPAGHVKKISFYNTPATTYYADDEQIPCWNVFWYSGIVEPGASGAPLFDQNKRVVGHMIGGVQTCATATTVASYASKFSENWAGGTGPASRLRDWLDPANTTMALDGYDPNGSPSLVAVRLKAMLQGPFIQASGLMSTALNDAGLVPLTEPYSAIGYVQHGGGGETTSQAVLNVTGTLRVVDWVVVELRNKNTPTTVVATRSCLLRRNGTIVDVDGVSDVTFMGLQADLYYVAVRHRNHLGIMTATARSLTATGSLIDLVNGSVSTYGGSSATTLVGTSRCLWAGDANMNGSLKYTGLMNDRDPMLLRLGGVIPTALFNGYALEDVNMDGVVKYTGNANDRDLLFSNVVSPTGIRAAQLP
ncbi:MAG: hypothetical protein ABIQ75_02615 [Flavobacteriales bacterium]